MKYKKLANIKTYAAATCLVSAICAVSAPLVPSASAESSSPGLDLMLYKVPDNPSWSIYVKKGERVASKFTVNEANVAGDVGELILRGPDGTEVQKVVLNRDTYPVGTEIKLNSPVAAEDGVYEIEAKYTKDSSSVLIGMEWTIGASTTDEVANIIPGRVWTDSYVIPHQRGAADLKLYVSTKDGYRYESNFKGYHGYVSRIVFDKYGVRYKNSCLSTYKSQGSNSRAGDTNTDVSYAKGADDSCKGVHKIFFAKPDPSLPEMVDTPKGSTWLNTAIKKPEINDLKFAADGDKAAPHKGKLTATVKNYENAVSVVVQIDLDGDGLFGGPKDRTYNTALVNGKLDFSFDGKDNAGNFIPKDVAVGFRLNTKPLGELHLLRNDVEFNDSIEIKRLNGSPNKRSWIYWNDTSLVHPYTGTVNKVAPTNNTAGVDSTGGVHGWSGGAGTDGLGDKRVVDDWAWDDDSIVVASTTHKVVETQPVNPPIAPNQPKKPAANTGTLADTGSSQIAAAGLSLLAVVVGGLAAIRRRF